MPVLTREELHANLIKLPWMEIDDFEFVVLGRTPGHRPPAAPAPNGHTPFWGTYQGNPDPIFLELKPTSPRQRLVVIDGEVQFESEGVRCTMKRRDFVEVPQSGGRVTNVGTSTAEIAIISGHWSKIIRNEICLFRPDKPCDYHYHDGDEYWFVFRGHFTLKYDGQEYDMKPGLMLAAGMGWEHGSPACEEHFEGVVMAMGLSGQNRDGHLNREMHGAPTKNREVPEELTRLHRKAAVLQTA